MSEKIKRKKVKVNITKAKKPRSFKKGLEIDLKSVMDEDDSAVSEPVLKSVKKEKKVKPEPVKKTVKPKQPKTPLNLYRKIAYSFIILTVGLLAIIFYFTFIKVTIIVTPHEERISNNLIVDVYDKNKTEKTSKSSVEGLIERINVGESKIYSAGGAEVIGAETIGTVVIINNYNKNQPLVATTRLLSSDNKLFRIKNTINVPAGGSIEAEVYADKPGADMAIGPTKFSIPGLWAGLQDKIYAESKEPMVHKEKLKKTIQQADVDSATRDIRKKLLVSAENEISKNYSNYSQRIFEIDENSVSVSMEGKVGEEVDEFTVEIEAAVVVIAFNDDPIKKMANDKLKSITANDRKLVDFNEENIVFSLDEQDYNNGTATINVTFEGRTIINSETGIIDREKIIGLSREQLNDYLDNESSISSYEVKFQPSFIKKVPNLADRIKVEIKK